MTTKSANALKTSLHSRSRLRFTFSRTDFSVFLLQDREGERRISFLGSTCICLFCPDPANASALVCIPLVLTQSPTDFSEKTCGNEAQLFARLAASALPLHSCASLHALQEVPLAWTVTLPKGWICLYIRILQGTGNTVGALLIHAINIHNK